MSRLIRWILALLVVAGIAFFIWQKTRPKPIEIVIKPVVRGIIKKTVANTRAGTVNACRRAKLSPSIGGQIAHLPIHEGDQVKAGSLLLEIWNEDLKDNWSWQSVRLLLPKHRPIVRAFRLQKLIDRRKEQNDSFVVKSILLNRPIELSLKPNRFKPNARLPEPLY